MIIVWHAYFFLLCSGTLHVGCMQPICQFCVLLVILDQYSIRRVLTIFLYICKCILVREAGVGGWIRRLMAGRACGCMLAFWVIGFCMYNLCVTYVYFCGMGFACMYMTTGWSPVMYIMMYVCMHVGMFSVC